MDSESRWSEWNMKKNKNTHIVFYLYMLSVSFNRFKCGIFGLFVLSFFLFQNYKLRFAQVFFELHFNTWNMNELFTNKNNCFFSSKYRNCSICIDHAVHESRNNTQTSETFQSYFHHVLSMREYYILWRMCALTSSRPDIVWRHWGILDTNVDVVGEL